MSDDLAKLGLQIDSSQTVDASKNLDALTASAGRTEKATDSLKFSSQEFAAALAANGNNIEKATASLAKNASATSAVAAAQRAATVQAAATAAANVSMAESLGALGSAAVRASAEQVAGAEAAAAATVAGAAVQKAANDHIAGSSTAVREGLTLLREASVGNFTRMAGSASILLQALGLLNAILIPLAVAGAVLGATFLTATQQINSGAEGTGDLTKGLGLTADQLDRVKERTVTFGDTVKATFQVLGRDILDALGGDSTMSAIKDAWNNTVQIIESMIAGLVGTVIGSVRVITEAWKAMPTALGGQGSTAGIDFGKAFQSGLDSARKSLNKFYEDVGDQARTNRTNQILKEAGNAPATTGDHQIDSATKQLAATQNQLKAQTALNDSVENGSVSFADMTKQEKLDADMKSIVAQRDADLAKNTEKSRTEAAALTNVINQLRPAYSALYDEQMQAKQIAANDNVRQQNALLEEQISLAGKTADQRALEIAQFKTLQDLRNRGIDPNSATGQTALGASADNVRRQQGLSRSNLLNAAPDTGTKIGTQAAQATLASDPDNYIKQQAAAYEEIDKLRQQDVLSEQQAAQAKAKVDADITASRLSSASDFFGNLASLSQSGNSRLAAIGKAAAVTQATIDGILAVQKALASFPPPLNFAMAAAVGVSAAVNVAKISGFAKGGVDIRGPGTGTSDSMLARISTGESVVTASATAKNRNTLAAMNDGAAFDGGGMGRAANTNITVVHDGSTAIRYEKTSDDEIRIIAGQVAEQKVRNLSPSVVAASQRDPNGTMAKATRDTVKAQRRRA